MSPIINSTVDLPAIVERVILPISLEVGRFNAWGEKDETGNVFIGPKALGITNVWAVLSRPLQPGQRGEMTLENVPGTKVINGIVSEWIPGAQGDWGPGFGNDKLKKLNIPYFGIALIAGIGLQRGENAVKVVGLNTFQAEVHMAAGIIIPVAS